MPDSTDPARESYNKLLDDATRSIAVLTERRRRTPPWKTRARRKIDSRLHTLQAALATLDTALAQLEALDRRWRWTATLEITPAAFKDDREQFITSLNYELDAMRRDTTAAALKEYANRRKLRNEFKAPTKENRT